MKTYRLIVLYANKTYDWFDFGMLHNVGIAITELAARKAESANPIMAMNVITLSDDVE